MAAGRAGLRYVSDRTPGIRRQAGKKAFHYLRPNGKPVADATTLARIKSLVIPPAWTSVWICPHAHGHIQVTARDARGRKQYRYHPRWRSTRDATKYEHVMGFARALPAIRRRVSRHLALPGLPREKVLAAVVRLLETTMMRVGNEEYARSNGSFGITTLRDEHVRIKGANLQFRFRGKSAKEHRIALSDRRLAAIVRRCREIPGYELFQYLDADGSRRTIGSGDVNRYLREITGEDYTAKDFRTWAGTLSAALALQAFERFDSRTQAKRNVVRAIETVASMLGNTPAICRKCYIHPAIVESYLDGTMRETLQRGTERAMRDARGLRSDEASVLALLHQRLEKPARRQRGKEKARATGIPGRARRTNARAAVGMPA